MKTVRITENKRIRNRLFSDRKSDCLFIISCPSSFKTFKFNGNIQILSTGLNYSTVNITPTTYIAKVYPDFRMSQSTDALCEFEFEIGKEFLVDKNFDDASNIMIFGKFTEPIHGRPLSVNVDIKSIEIQMIDEVI